MEAPCGFRMLPVRSRAGRFSSFCGGRKERVCVGVSGWGVGVDRVIESEGE